MELVSFPLPRSTKKFVLAPLGDFQWSGPKGSTAEGHLKSHIEECMEMDAFFIGTGDYTDFLSPSNRARLMSAGLYDTAKDAIFEKAMELSEEVFEKFLKPTKGRWLGLVEGHHFYEENGSTTDQHLADLLQTKHLGTSAFVHIPAIDFTIYVHHGRGGGKLPSAPINTLYHQAAGLPEADVYIMGHSTKLTGTRLSRPFPVWERIPRLNNHDILLVNCGGFSKSNVVGSRHGSIPRGDYAEQGLMTPSPLTAPIITVNVKAKYNKIRVSI